MALRVLLGVLGLLIMLTASAFAQIAPTAPVIAAPPQLTLSASPQALPNDGRSTASITVLLKDAAGAPLANVKLQGEVRAGDGQLDREATTDRDGRATFSYRTGFAPRDGVLVIREASGASAQLTVPLAAVSYLDLLLVTPQEYEAYKRRQASAAPIYTLKLSVFPAQLAADGGSVAHAVATLTFADGRPAPGVPLKADAGSAGRVDSAQRATDATGRMSFYFTAGRTPGTAMLRITEPSTGLVASAAILLVPPGPARIEIKVDDGGAIETPHDGTLLPADGMTELPLLIRVTDLYGMALSGAEVKLEVLDLGSGWIELRDERSSAFGELHAVYHCGSITGAVRLRAWVAQTTSPAGL